MPRDTERSRPWPCQESLCSTLVAQVGGHGADLVIAQQRHQGHEGAATEPSVGGNALEHHIQLAGRAAQQGVTGFKAQGPR